MIAQSNADVLPGHVETVDPNFLQLLLMDEAAEAADQNKQGSKEEEEEEEEPRWKAAARVLRGMLWDKGLLSLAQMFRGLFYLYPEQQNQQSQPQRRRRRIAKNQDVQIQTPEGQESAPRASWKQVLQSAGSPMPTLQVDQETLDMLAITNAKWDIISQRLDGVEARMASADALMQRLAEEVEELWESPPDSGYGSE
ncbi:Diphthamide biosynthesis protein 1 [Ascosphaera pollenicola]|nr:Diphthamide biosynthesis protein 1 [Ascosphaera pollenicola]